MAMIAQLRLPELRSRWGIGTTRATSAWSRSRAARTWLAERLSIFTGLGLAGVLAAVVALWVGATRDWAELTVLGVFVLIALSCAFAWTWGRSTYEAKVELKELRVRVGEEAIGRLVITNRSRRSLLPTRIELPVGRAVAAFDLASLGHDEEDEQLFAVPTRRRGVITIGPVRSVRIDPLQLMRREQQWTDQVELFVHPRTVLIDSNKAGFLKDVEGVTTQDLSSSDVSFHALREYVPGDDRRAIHWRTTARTGRFMVRVFEETRRSHLLVLLSVRPEDYTTSDDFETAVSCVGSLGVQCFREDRELSVVTQAGQLRFPSAPGLLDALSRVELVAGSAPVARLVEQGLSRVPGASIVSVVTGADVDANTLRSADLSIPLDAYAVAMRCGAHLAPARRKVGRLNVLDLSRLDELPRAMRTLR